MGSRKYNFGKIITSATDGSQSIWVYQENGNGKRAKIKLGLRYILPPNQRTLVRIWGPKIPARDWNEVSRTVWQIKADHDSGQQNLSLK